MSQYCIHERAPQYISYLSRALGSARSPYPSIVISTSSTLDCGNNTFLCALYILLDRECSPLVHCTSTMGLHIHNLESQQAKRYGVPPNIHTSTITFATVRVQLHSKTLFFHSSKDFVYLVCL